ncbi:MAG: cytochrome c3 family protein [Leptolyngbyaceae cyanobacterium CSU_1_4]|nr:cytochrome c3 family protein [Leptolyngbyaceae cyanobacterium CSU_1_4]
MASEDVESQLAEAKAEKAKNPALEIEIPAEFDKQWPSASACQSAVDAWDPEAPGPKQPIPFSHKHHAGQFKIECLYCHADTDKSQAAGARPVELCMGCHAQFPLEYDEIEGIRILKQHWEEKKPIEWVQIHRLPEHVQFRHNRHVAAGIECQQCHGKVEEMDKVHLVPDTKWWPWLLPTQKLEMGWCVQCHRANGASQDCVTCHY